MPLVPFDTSKSKWLESGEIVRVKDQTDSNYDRDGEVTDRTIYGGTVHFEDCDVKYRNDQLERLGQRRTVLWRIVGLPKDFDAGDPDDDTPPTEDNDDQDLEPIDDIFAPPVPADWYPS